MRITRIVAALLVWVLLMLSACGTPAPTTPTPPEPTTPTTPAPTTPTPPELTTPTTPLPAPTIPIGPGPSEVWIPRVVGAGRQFLPSAITVSVGTTVTWTNKDIDVHTVTFNNGLLDMQLTGGTSSNHTFTERGTFYYYCEIWSHEGMVGTVIVE